MATVVTPKAVIPGPRGLPFIGGKTRLLNFYQQPFTFLRSLYTTYGEVAGLAKGDTSYVFGFGPAQNLHILAHPETFITSSGPFFGKLSKNTSLGRLFLNNLPLMNGEQHRRHRRLMQPAFYKRQIALYGEDMANLTRQMLETWQEQTDVDLNREMKKLTQHIAVKTLFGLNDEVELEHISILLRNLATAQMPLAMLLPVNIPGFPYARMLHMAEQLEAFVHSMITAKRSQNDAMDVLAMLLHAYDEDGTQLSNDELLGHIFTLFIAGHETTSNALTWAIFLLAQHPRVSADLLDELDSVLHGSAPTVEHFKQLPLLDGVIKETLRLLPPASIGIRVATEPCELGGFPLPRGSNVFYSPFLTHRMPELYEEPDRFKPERWAMLDRTAYEYLPFGAGQHMCIGAGFAIQEMKVVLSILLQQYRLEPQPNASIKINMMMTSPRNMLMRVFPQDRQFQRIAVRGDIHSLVDFTE